MLTDNIKKETIQTALLAGSSTNMIREMIGFKLAIYYGPEVMTKAGFEGRNFAANLTTISLSGTVVSVFLVDTLGRRTIMLVSLTSVLFSSMYLFFQFMTPDQETGVLPFIVMNTLIFFYCLGFAATPITLNSEVHPSEFRVAGCAIAHTCGSLTALLSAIFINDWTNPNLFLLNCFFAILGIVSTVFCVPETKGVDLGKINEILRKKIW